MPEFVNAVTKDHNFPWIFIWSACDDNAPTCRLLGYVFAPTLIDAINNALKNVEMMNLMDAVAFAPGGYDGNIPKDSWVKPADPQQAAIEFHLRYRNRQIFIFNPLMPNEWSSKVLFDKQRQQH